MTSEQMAMISADPAVMHGRREDLTRLAEPSLARAVAALQRDLLRIRRPRPTLGLH